jgi:hypothetical protein
MEEIYNEYLSKALGKYYSDEIFIKYYKCVPSMRDVSFKYCLDYFKEKDNLNILELGTSRSFVDGTYPGVLVNDKKYWEPDNLNIWDWSAGLFTKYFPDILEERGKKYHLTTVDINNNALEISKVITENNKKNITYLNNSSESQIKKTPPRSIDLLYLDTGDMDYTTAELQLREAILIVKQDIIKENGLILIDDVRNPNNDFTRQNLGKSLFSIPFLLQNGFKLMLNEYQVILKKV